MTRTFIALELNSALQRHLAGAIRQMAKVLPSIRWVDPAGIHLTLAFLGELSAEELEAAKDATMHVARQCESFTYQLSRLNIFGSAEQPRVIWMGIGEQSGMLQRVHRVMNEELRQRGFEVEARPFSPHFTLARVKAPLSTDEKRGLRRLLVGNHEGIATVVSFAAEELVVMKSELSESGARYSVVEGYRLL